MPIKWSNYFDKEEDITTENGSFHVYCKGTEGPILICLHGGGYSGLTWALFAEKISALIQCQIRALDLRGHGKTSTNNDADLSLETLAGDVVDITKLLSQESEDTVVLIGHSMGGAVAVEAAHHIENVVGLCVIDVVEGAALDALSSMHTVLRGRPPNFASVPQAIQWWYKSGQTCNLEAARVSMPGQIVNMKTGKLAADESFDLKDVELPSMSHQEAVAAAFTLSEVAEEPEENDCSEKNVDIGKPPVYKSEKTDTTIMPKPKTQPEEPKYSWRINLSKTEPFWTGWFKGLSQKFLDLRIPKLLLLANVFGLDTTLTVGQMQGKFQLAILSKSGHAIHEDQPQNVAEILSEYLIKQKIASS